MLISEGEVPLEENGGYDSTVNISDVDESLTGLAAKVRDEASQAAGQANAGSAPPAGAGKAAKSKKGNLLKMIASEILRTRVVLYIATLTGYLSIHFKESATT